MGVSGSSRSPLSSIRARSCGCATRIATRVPGAMYSVWPARVTRSAHGCSVTSARSTAARCSSFVSSSRMSVLIVGRRPTLLVERLRTPRLAPRYTGYRVRGADDQRGGTTAARARVIGSTRTLRVWAYPEPADLRTGFDGLSALVSSKLGRPPTVTVTCTKEPGEHAEHQPDPPHKPPRTARTKPGVIFLPLKVDG